MELFEDRVGGSRPLERATGGVVVIDEVLDASDEVPDVAKRSASNGALRDQAKPPFHLIDPRTARQPVMDVIARPAGEPSLHGRVLVRRIVGDNQMHVERRRHIGISVPQEAEEFLMAVARAGTRAAPASCSLTPDSTPQTPAHKTSARTASILPTPPVW